MRLFGIDFGGKAASKPAETATPPPVAASTRTYADPWGFQPEIPAPVDYAIYDAVVQAIPFLDVALRKLTRMVSGFEVTSDNEATAATLNEWLKIVPVNSIFKGFQSFAQPHIRQCLQYGKSAGEIALTESKREIGGLFVIGTQQLCLIPDKETGGIILGERNMLGQVVPYEAQDLFVYSAWGKEGDSPHGSSLLRSVPWIADIVLRMELAIRQKWQRHGAPSFLVAYEAVSNVAIPDATLTAIKNALAAEWEKAMKARWRGEGIVDFFMASQGKVSATPIDSSSELNFQEPYRALVEQIVSTTELAPFMLGLQWSTTERLSQQQADAIIGCVGAMREELEPDFLHILGWQQRLSNLRGTIGVKWADVNLQDRTETATADLTNAQAQKLRTENALAAWRNGWTDQLGAAQEAGYDIEAVVVPMDSPAGNAAPANPFGEALQSRARGLWRQYP